MQNQPGTGPRPQDPAHARHDKQAAGLNEDAFKGGSGKNTPRRLGWLRNPWKPAAGRLWPGKDRTGDE